MMELIGLVPAENGGMRCQVEICKAACCRCSSFRPDKPGPCEYLTERHTCELHEVGGDACKPKGCADYPQTQSDIDGMNQQLESAGIQERCLLQFK